ncbi:MAG: hypothetical protein ACI9JE_001291, partial [Candidatus Krumholzibacteriia bacterium]
MLFVIGGGLLLGWSAVNVCAAEPLFEPLPKHQTWHWDMTAGFDSYLHSYALAIEDTTETIAEFMVQGGVEGRSDYGQENRWRMRAEASAGTELYRQRIEAEYRHLGSDRIDRVRFLGSFRGRQYREKTEYSLSSNNWEGRLEGRVAPLVGKRMKLELRGWAGRIDYDTPSTLEVDHDDLGGGAFIRSTNTEQTTWGLGARRGHRAYPDSSSIDRDTWSVEGDLDTRDDRNQNMRGFHKSERRVVRDETVRPSAWTHWTDLGGALSLGQGQIFLEVQSETWQYDRETDVYFNSNRIEAHAGYRWGDILTATWKLGLAAERLDAGDSPEQYGQLGLRAGVESYGAAVGGSLTLEYGRRNYEQGVVDLAPVGVELQPSDEFSDDT